MEIGRQVFNVLLVSHVVVISVHISMVFCYTLNVGYIDTVRSFLPVGKAFH